MRQFKNKTIALILASTITVAGAFGAENYKNSLMSVKFENTDSGAVNMLLMTKNNYAGTINPIKKDANTYIIMLPEINAHLMNKPELGSCIESMNIRTMPYTNTNKGYTKITIKTVPNVQFNAKSELYLPDNSTETPQLSNKQPAEPTPRRVDMPIQTNNYNNTTPSMQNEKPAQPLTDSSPNQSTDTKQPDEKEITDTNQAEPIVPQTSNQQKQNSIQTQDVTYTEKYLIILSLLLISVACIYFYIKGKNKIAEIIGEQSNYDISDETAKQKPKTKATVKSTINKIDKTYTKPMKMPISDYNNISVVETVNNDAIVDLDELFQAKSQEETKKTEEENEINIEENKALEDFLNGFSFAEEVQGQEVEHQYQTELYEKCLNSNHISFTKEDIQCIQALLNTEINDDTLNNLSKYAITTPIEKPAEAPKFLLENLVTTYSIQQNVIFTREDIEALNKLINVEIDNDFLTDLRVNPEKQAIMRAEIEKQKSYSHKTSEILTLNVKDMLPDLSSALKAQKGKTIQYEVKTDAVYINENTDIQILSVKNELPDLKKEIHNKDAYKSKPSEELQVVDNSYEVDTISVADDLPDLAEAFKHPEKYNTQTNNPKIIDEEKLLQSITNVSLKPFSEENSSDNQDNEIAPTMNDIQEEMEQFREIEIVNESDETQTENTVNNDSEDFAELMENQYIDLDKSKQNKSSQNIVQSLLKKIEEQKAEHITKRSTKNILPPKNEKKKVQTNKYPKSCTIQNEEFEIVSGANLTETVGCYLANNKEESAIIGFTKNKLFKIKSYEHLKNTKIQVRVNEKFSNDACQYLVKVGTHKILLNVYDDELEFVMELC